MEHIRIIGTSHIASQSVREIREQVELFNPDIIAVELDKTRLASLLSTDKTTIRIKDIFKVGFKGYAFAMLGAWAEKKLGDHVGMKPGADMLEGVNLAKKNKLMIAFIDQDISITLKKLSKGISWKERWNFVADIFKGVVLRKKEVEFDLSTVPDEKTISTMIKTVKKRYPNIYRILVSERNTFMAARLNLLQQNFPGRRILALVGAGHLKGIQPLVTKNAPKPVYSYSFRTEVF